MSPEMGMLVGLIVAVVLGALIGLERRLRHHPAGLHMNALVALGSAAYVIAGTLAGDDPTGPARVVGQVVTGIGFLGAGVILHQGATIRGINTAATVWCSSAVGVFAGLGEIPWACALAVLVLIANIVLHFIEHRLPGSDPGA